MEPAPSRGAPPGSWPRGLEYLALLLLVFLALGLRTYDLAARPMHADEANQAVKLGQMLEGSTYVFDPQDHHGPTLYYLGMVPAWLRGERTLATLTETTVRLTPALAGVGAVALLWVLARPLGFWPGLLAGSLLAVSPTAVYYSRYFIQETLLVTFTLGSWVCGRRWWQTGDNRWAAMGGVCLGLMVATKSSAVVFAAASLLALVAVETRSMRPLGRGAAIAAGAAIFVGALFYSSFGANPAGLRDALLAPAVMLVRATGDATGHEKPWWYYASLFLYRRNGGYVWDQTLFLFLGLVGGLVAARQKGMGRFVAIYTAIAAAILSATPYKTPWQVVNLIPGLCLLAASFLAQRRGALAAPLALLVLLGLGWQTRQAVFLRPADERNPFAYAHTAPDMLKVQALARAAPPGPILVVSDEYWPLPWYLRHRKEAGYWTTPPADCDGALVFAGATQADAVRSRLRGRYRESYLGLRPGVMLAVFERQAD